MQSVLIRLKRRERDYWMGREWTSQMESAGIKSEITSQQQVEAAERSDLFVVTDAF